MLKKAGIVTFGVSAALVAAAPFASAGEADAAKSDSGSNSSHSKDSDGHGKGHGKHHGVGNTSCKSQSGNVEGNEALGIGSILDGNSGQLASCNSFLNDVGSHNKVKVGEHLLDLGDTDLGDLPEVPST